MAEGALLIAKVLMVGWRWLDLPGWVVTQQAIISPV
jgi:hypothetical protein